MAEEKRFENKVKEYLKSIGCYPFGTPEDKITQNVIGYYEKRWGGGQFTKAGLPDMHVVIKGKSIDLELKAPNGKPSELQLKNLYFINKNSRAYILVNKLDDAVKLSKWIRINYPKYETIPVIDFETFKGICEG